MKWVQWAAAGVEGMDDQMKAHPAVVTNYARTFAHGISETAFALLLSLTRGITKYYGPAFNKRQMVPVGLGHPRAIELEIAEGPRGILEARPCAATDGDSSAARAALEGHGAHTTCNPFVRLNVELVQNTAALRYQAW